MTVTDALATKNSATTPRKARWDEASSSDMLIHQVSASV